jgi:hypothetical protein
MRDRRNMPCARMLCAMFLLGASASTGAQQAVIDIHVHAGNVVQAGPRHPDNLGVMHGYEEEANENNVVLFVASGAQEFVESWSEYFGSRMLAGPVFPCVNGMTANEEATDGRRSCFDTGTEFPDLAWLRRQYEDGHLQVMGELGPQYLGMPVDDPRMSPYYALAADLDIPTLIHVGGGPPLTAERCCPDFRLSVGDPMLVEEVLVQNPRLRVQIQHANVLAYPALFRLLQQFPHVFVDLTPFQTILPREGFHHMLRLYQMQGLIDRIMFGSDEMPVAASLEAYRSADFLSAEELNGILCGNAERFLGLPGTCAAKTQ